MIAWGFFDVRPYFGVLAVLLTFVLSLVACRATGESDITPTGAMSKIMQFMDPGADRLHPATRSRARCRKDRLENDRALSGRVGDQLRS